MNHKQPCIQLPQSANPPAFNKKKIVALWADVQKELIELREMIDAAEQSKDFVNSDEDMKNESRQ